ncbi:MAG: hypothetical protein WKF78_14900 [Candidatus Limnocylindrales bacterium]
MLRTYYLNGYYRDPILLQVDYLDVKEARVTHEVHLAPTTAPRWLRLERSGVGLRSVAEGFELQGSEDEVLHQLLLEICTQREDVTMNDERIVLNVTQADHAGDLIDDVDRVVCWARSS